MRKHRLLGIVVAAGLALGSASIPINQRLIIQ